jgi:hypothetical protein
MLAFAQLTPGNAKQVMTKWADSTVEIERLAKVVVWLGIGRLGRFRFVGLDQIFNEAAQ